MPESTDSRRPEPLAQKRQAIFNAQTAADAIAGEDGTIHLRLEEAYRKAGTAEDPVAAMQAVTQNAQAFAANVSALAAPLTPKQSDAADKAAHAIYQELSTAAHSLATRHSHKSFLDGNSDTAQPDDGRALIDLAARAARYYAGTLNLFPDKESRAVLDYRVHMKVDDAHAELQTTLHNSDAQFPPQLLEHMGHELAAMARTSRLEKYGNGQAQGEGWGSDVGDGRQKLHLVSGGRNA